MSNVSRRDVMMGLGAIPAIRPGSDLSFADTVSTGSNASPESLQPSRLMLPQHPFAIGQLLAEIAQRYFIWDQPGTFEVSSSGSEIAALHAVAGDGTVATICTSRALVMARSYGLPLVSIAQVTSGLSMRIATMSGRGISTLDQVARSRLLAHSDTERNLWRLIASPDSCDTAASLDFRDSRLAWYAALSTGEVDAALIMLGEAVAGSATGYAFDYLNPNWTSQLPGSCLVVSSRSLLDRRARREIEEVVQALGAASAFLLEQPAAAAEQFLLHRLEGHFRPEQIALEFCRSLAVDVSSRTSATRPFVRHNRDAWSRMIAVMARLEPDLRELKVRDLITDDLMPRLDLSAHARARAAARQSTPSPTLSVAIEAMRDSLPV